MLLLILILSCVPHTKVVASALQYQNPTDPTQHDRNQTELNGGTSRPKVRKSIGIVLADLCKNPLSIEEYQFSKLRDYVDIEHSDVIDKVEDAAEKIYRAKQLLPLIECVVTAYKSNYTFKKTRLPSGTEKTGGHEGQVVISRRMIDTIDAMSETNEHSFITRSKKRWEDMKRILDPLANEYSKITDTQDKIWDEGVTNTNDTDKTDLKNERIHTELKDFALITQKTAMKMCRNPQSIDRLAVPKIAIYVANEFYDVIDAENPKIKADLERQLQPIIDCLAYALKLAKGDIDNENGG